jgi:hypothetical protein
VSRDPENQSVTELSVSVVSVLLEVASVAHLKGLAAGVASGAALV